MILIIGAGAAGLTAARAAHAAGADVTLVTAGTLALGDACSTAMAQGGIAAAVGAGDRALSHLNDTVEAGAGLVDVEAARVLVGDGAADVRRLLTAGFAADRGATGELELGLEGAHSTRRIVHAGGDRTGAVLHEHLVSQLPASVRVFERTTLERLLVTGGAVVGAVLARAGGATETVQASAVVLATGGYSALYDRTSNHSGARGAGIAAAAEAGAVVADLEFVQFHPTVLAGTGQLISEAVRGAGAVLRDSTGSQFMVGRHPGADLAPRDVVSREIHRVLRDSGGNCVWLDARGIEAERGRGSLARVFPGIDEALRARGLNWADEPVPVVPAAHYTMGGVASDLDGRTSLPGLFVAGEVAATGVHGANRLASNSLLEGLVFGRRAGTAAAEFAAGFAAGGAWEFSGTAMPRLVRGAETVGASACINTDSRGADLFNTDFLSADFHSTDVTGTHHLNPNLVNTTQAAADAHGLDPRIGQLLSQQLGIERDNASMTAARSVFAALPGPDARLAELIAHAALARTESRGGHQRVDFPSVDPAQAERRGYRIAAPARAVTPPPSTDRVRRSLAPC